jgi:anti-sigma factor RsiW
VTTDRCEEMRLKLQADLDGELDAGDAAVVAAHMTTCADCAEAQAELRALSSRLRTELPYHAAPAHLREAIAAKLAPPVPVAPPRPARNWFRPSRLRVGFGASFGAGFAIAASLALFLILPRGGDMADSVVASHIRALQPGHLMDVVSTDQHTVKPWFDGRLDFAPPVKDLASDGFPLIGGRLDYLDGRPVAALTYRRAKHVIDLYVWPSANGLAAPIAEGEHNGYNFEHWTQDGMIFWTVSDVSPADLGEFVKLWRAAH